MQLKTGAKDVITEHKPHTSRRQRALLSPSHPLAAMQWSRLLLLAAYGAWRTPCHALSTGILSSYSFFLSLVSGDLDL